MIDSYLSRSMAEARVYPTRPLNYSFNKLELLPSLPRWPLAPH